MDTASDKAPVRRIGRGRGPSEDGFLTSGDCLRVPGLLSIQHLLSDPAAHDELLFIVVHQAYELWFKQLIFELESIRDRMLDGDPERARHYLTRVHAIERVIIEHIEVLQTMTPQEFLEFRSNLSPASGFQSAQFREIEFISGLKDERYLDDVAHSPIERERLQRRLRERTLWDGFCELLTARGLPMPPDEEETRRESLVAMAREAKHAELFAVSEGLLDHDEGVAVWRNNHILMVERQIGGKRGTGGSSGVSYLKTTLEKRFYPELWDLRSYL